MHACQGCQSQRFNTKRFVSGLITRQAEADGPPLPPPPLWAAVIDNQLRLAKIRPGPSVNHFQRKHGRRSRIEWGQILVLMTSQNPLVFTRLVRKQILSRCDVCFLACEQAQRLTPCWRSDTSHVNRQMCVNISECRGLPLGWQTRSLLASAAACSVLRVCCSSSGCRSPT